MENDMVQEPITSEEPNNWGRPSPEYNSQVFSNQRNTNDKTLEKGANLECVKNAVAGYLKRRNYNIAENDGEMALLSAVYIPANEAKETTIVRGEALNHNTILYSPANIDTHTLKLVDQQFSKMLLFINNIKKEVIKRELLFVMPIMLTHVYLDLLKGVSRKTALGFLKRQSNAIHKSEVQGTDFPLNFFQMQENCALIESFNETSTFTDWLTEVVLELTGCKEEADAHTMPILLLFRSMKQRVRISHEAATSLKKYLSKNVHTVLLHILNKWFMYEIAPCINNNGAKVNGINNYEEKENECDNEDMMSLRSPVYSVCDQVPKELIQSSTEGKSKESTESSIKIEASIPAPAIRDEFEELKEVVRRMKKVEKIKITNLINADEVTCAITDRTTMTRAVGFTNSDIFLCNNYRDWRMNIDFEAISEQDHVGFSWIKNSERKLYGHSNGITDVQFTQSQSYVIAASFNTTLKLWKLSTGCEVFTYDGHQKPIWCIDVSPNDYYIATGSHDNTARLWAIDRHHSIRMFAGHTLDVECVQFHKNGSYIATGSKDTTVRLFSVSDGKVLRLLNDASGMISTVAFSPNGKLLAGAGEDKTIHIWDLGTGKRLYELTGHKGHIISLAWDPSSEQNKMISGTLSGEIKVWNYKSGSDWTISNVSEDVYERIVKIEFLQKNNSWAGHIFAIPGYHDFD